MDVSLTASLAGHAVPTGASFLRRVWIDVELTSRSGATTTIPGVLELGARLTKGGQDVALITDADHIERRSLAPGETRTVHLPTPPGAWASAKVRLRARAITEEALFSLGLSARASEVPLLEVAAIGIALQR
jgi:hypothetical protein